MTTILSVLDQRLTDAGIPIHGVSDNGDGTYRVDFTAAATAQQQSDAAAIVAAFDAEAEQGILDGLEAGKTEAHSGALAWFVAHPNAALLFNLSIAALDAEIDSLVDALFPAASAANKNRMKLWMKTVSHSIRALAKREGFTS